MADIMIKIVDFGLKWLILTNLFLERFVVIHYYSLLLLQHIFSQSCLQNFSKKPQYGKLSNFTKFQNCI